MTEICKNPICGHEEGSHECIKGIIGKCMECPCEKFEPQDSTVSIQQKGTVKGTAQVNSSKELGKLIKRDLKQLEKNQVHEISHPKSCGKFIPVDPSDKSSEGWQCGLYYDSFKKVFLCGECKKFEAEKKVEDKCKNCGHAEKYHELHEKTKLKPCDKFEEKTK